jgi:hypothetical protein
MAGRARTTPPAAGFRICASCGSWIGLVARRLVLANRALACLFHVGADALSLSATHRPGGAMRPEGSFE